MWTYQQSTGEIVNPDGEVIGSGYSGADIPGTGQQGKNNPAMQSVHHIGPCPQGVYNILEPRETESHGPYAMPLAPDPANQMFGRSAFLIHGDSVHAPGTASEGCIILARPIREKIWDSGDHQLTVVA
jgi:Protein of unknown function (DUF2778)